MVHHKLLRVACPDCGHSLMDPGHPIDGAPGIHVIATRDGARGDIWLSSFYGRYGLDADLEIADGNVLTLSCPHCDASLDGPFPCDHCGSRLSRLAVRGGGHVNVCNRVGCHRHFLEVDDGSDEDATPPPGLPDLVHEPLDGPSTMEAGSFLASFCPHCEVSLLDDEGITFLVTAADGTEGRLTLSPYLNVFTHTSTIDIPDRSEARDVRCPHCGHTLVCDEVRCGECGGRTAHITVSAMRKLIAFHVCMVEGCRWHGLSERDTQLIRLEDSLEW